jgi:S-DNA-T family DNA segregation ATPase FtsK/SpoIIIE
MKCESHFEIANPDPGPAREPSPAEPRAGIPSNPPPLLGGEATLGRLKPPGHLRDTPEDMTREPVAARPRTAPHPASLRLPVGKKLSLAVIAGPDAGKTFPIDKPRVVVGGAGSDVVLTDAEISRSHAALEVDDDAVTVFDLGSTNGTYFGGERVESTPLDHYGEFEVGGTTLMLIVTHE